MRKYPNAPHPFVLTPPLESRRSYNAGEDIAFELTLIGKAIDYLPYFIYTFEELGQMGIGKGRAKYQLQEVRSNACEQEKRLIYSSVDKIFHNSHRVVTTEDLLRSKKHNNTASSISLHFITPARIKYDSRLTLTLEFHILLRNLLRRISMLSYFHCGEELDIEYKGLIQSAKDITTTHKDLRWMDWESYSARQDTRMKMGGFVGKVTFFGDMREYLPFILLGERVHVGKGSSFGLGKYEISS